MPLFRRKESKESVPADDESARGATENEVEAPTADDDLVGEPDFEAETTAEPPPLAGPWDVQDPPQDDLPRLDLGGLQVPGFPGMELRLEMDTATERVIAATAVAHGGQLQIQAFAAPRRGGIWSEVRAEIVEGVGSAGGTIKESSGRFGVELVGQVPAVEAPESLQPARFVGVDGPRWFLRGVFTGAAVTAGESADLLEQVFAGTLVVRGDLAMAPRDLLTLTMPAQGAPAAPEASEDPGRPPLPPLRRGPEITEIR